MRATPRLGKLFIVMRQGVGMNNLSIPDALCASFAERPDKITLRAAADGTVLVEGSASALEFLGNLLIAQAQTQTDCGFQLSPSGAGSALFSSSSNLGIYIHRTPCAHAP